jgi:hypothetical protein
VHTRLSPIGIIEALAPIRQLNTDFEMMSDLWDCTSQDHEKKLVQTLCLGNKGLQLNSILSRLTSDSPSLPPSISTSHQAPHQHIWEKSLHEPPFPPPFHIPSPSVVQQRRSAIPAACTSASRQRHRLPCTHSRPNNEIPPADRSSCLKSGGEP